MLFVGWLFYFDIVRHKTTQSYGVWQSVDADGMSLYYCRLLLLPLLSSFLSRLPISLSFSPRISRTAANILLGIHDLVVLHAVLHVG